MSLSINVELYWRQKQPSIDWFYTQGKCDAGYTIGTLACVTMVPCIVIAVWVGSVNGFDEFLINRIKNLITFYGYTEILNTPENYPEELVKFLET
jgi:hypothetical protein